MRSSSPFTSSTTISKTISKAPRAASGQHVIRYSVTEQHAAQKLHEVRWEGVLETDAYFEIADGMQQGTVLAPFLFVVYTKAG